MTFGLPLKKSRGMAKNQLEISQRASLDLESIAIVTIQHWGKQQSRKYKNSLAAAFKLIQGSPYLGESCHFCAFRRFKCKSHFIYYLYQEKNHNVLIIRILHHRQNVEKSLRGGEGFF